MLNRLFEKKLSAFGFVLISFAFVAIFAGCSKKTSQTNEAETTIVEDISKETHTWYAFTQNGFEKIDLPQNAVELPHKAWTESIRVSGANTSADKLDKTMPKAFALVNQLGLLVFEGDKIELHADVSLFPNNTAKNLFFDNNTPYFSVYKSVFFNEETSVQKSPAKNSRPFLLQYDEDSKIFFPVLNYENLNLNSNDQITDFSWDKSQFLLSVKTTQNQKNSFSYLCAAPSVTLSALTPQSTNKSLLVSPSDAEEFRQSKAPRDFSKAPLRVRNLLGAIPTTLPFYLECSYAGGTLPEYFEQAIFSQNTALEAKATVADTWAMAIFADGTSYFSGACYGRPVLADGKTVAFRLPKLPEGFLYSYFALSGTQLYVAWEETSFYETGKSGFISLNLDTILYRKLR